MVSADDVRMRYCGWCHWWTGRPSDAIKRPDLFSGGLVTPGYIGIDRSLWDDRLLWSTIAVLLAAFEGTATIGVGQWDDAVTVTTPELADAPMLGARFVSDQEFEACAQMRIFLAAVVAQHGRPVSVGGELWRSVRWGCATAELGLSYDTVHGVTTIAVVDKGLRLVRTAGVVP